MPPIKATEFDGDFSEFLRQYKYQPMLTRKLDGLGDGSLTPELVNEIVLFRVMQAPQNRLQLLGTDNLPVSALRKRFPEWFLYRQQ